MARSPRRAGPRPKAARTAISRPRSGAAPGTAARSRSATSGTTNHPIQGNCHSKFGQDHTPWGFDDRRPLGSSLPATLSTGAPRRARRRPTSARRRNLGHGCTNCYARSARHRPELGSRRQRHRPDWRPPAPATLDWSNFNTPGNSGTNGLRNQFDPYRHRLVRRAPGTQRRPHHRRPAADQQHLVLRLGLLQQPPRPFPQPVELEPVGQQRHLQRRDSDVQSLLSDGNAPTNLRANYNIGWESPRITTFYELAQRYQLGLNIALPGDWSGRVWYAMTNDANFNHRSGTINKAAVSAALGLDDRRHAGRPAPRPRSARGRSPPTFPI